MRVLGLILCACIFLGACETIKGVGRDIESAGEALDDAVDSD
ncbi:MAG: entericidin A/B family lipoprotein [Parvularculaceae bacterium]